MSERRRLAAVLVATALLAVLATLAVPDRMAATAVVLVGGVVVGELLVLRLEDGSQLPIGYALLPVLALQWRAPQSLAVLLAGQFLAAAVARRGGWRARSVTLALRVATGAAAIAVTQVLHRAIDRPEQLATLLLALGAGFACVLAGDEVVRRLTGLAGGLTVRGRLGWLALVSSGLLMAAGAHGVAGRGRLGVWAAVMFSVPLIATWYSFEQLDSITRTQSQTIRALALAPELGGFVRAGHSERVAVLAHQIGREVGIDGDELADLETAAWLHHLGQVTLDEPPPGRATTASEVAAVTARMLREIDRLAPAGDIVAGESHPYRQPGTGRAAAPRLASQVLKVAIAYDDLTAGDDARAVLAIEALYASPGYVYDSRVLEALERVLMRTARVRALV